MLTIQQKHNVFFATTNSNLQLKYNVNLEMSLDKTLLTLTALRDGLKILWKPAAFWTAKDR